MALTTKPNLTLSELKQMWVELLLNKTDKVSDVSDDSVLNGVAFGDAKVGQKTMKDIAITESKIFPQTAKGTYLDDAADLFGVSARRGAIGSSTFLKIIADKGTQYLSATNTFIGNNGVRFEMESDFTMGDLGYDYIKVRSVDTGVKTNVDANTINTVTPIPTGHTNVINEYFATGAADAETDEVFRLRIVNNNNILSLTTLEYYNQVFQNLDDRILKTLNIGRDEDGNKVLGIVTQNGVGLTQNELDDLLEQAKDFFPITDLNQFGNTIGIVLKNVEWYEVGGGTGIDFRAEINSSYAIDDVRIQIQTNLSKKLDFRFWEVGQKVEWDDLFETVKNTEGVKYVPDTTFYPNNDESVPLNKLPRIKIFVMRDLDGNIVYDSSGVLSPIFYPNE